MGEGQAVEGEFQSQRYGRAMALIKLAWPLILGQGCWTVQILVDRILLSQAGGEEVGSAMMGALLFWPLFTLCQHTANYATTFVAQYMGAGRPDRAGPSTWQSLHFSFVVGFFFVVLAPLVGWIVGLTGHSAELQQQETIYCRCLCFSAFPMLVIASVTSFFAGRGNSGVVLFVNAVAMVVNALCDYAWIFGKWGFPAWGIAGAGWATVAGTGAGALVALAFFFLPSNRREHGTLSGWRLEPWLFGRLMWYGLPSGMLAALDTLGFTLFLLIIGRYGANALSASSIAFTLNMVAILPMLGLGQAVGILVGQRLGENQPNEAARITWVGLWLTILFVGVLACLYLFAPGLLLWPFQPQEIGPEWREVQKTVIVLLRFIAFYCFFDSLTLVFMYALRGAGDTRFVTVLALVLSWPVMVIPSYLAQRAGWALYWPWVFASTYICLLGLTFLARFLQGKWRTMRVIETSGKSHAVLSQVEKEPQPVQV